MQSVMNHSFAQVPSANVGRSKFDLSHGHKTTIDADYIYPLTWMEVIPGDTFNVRGNIFARMTTPIYPLMDNLHIDTFYFFVPYRILWSNWERFLGAQDDPGDTIDFTIPTVANSASGFAELSLYDYMGVPPLVDLDANDVDVCAFPFRAYDKIWNDWFRDENLQDSLTENTGDGPDADSYTIQKRGKRHDYFTSCLPWTQKQDTAVSLPLGTEARIAFDGADNTNIGIYSTAAPGGRAMDNVSTTVQLRSETAETDLLYADLTNATAATINAIRLAVTTQQFLERDARAGTRINEIILSHFGVTVPDYRVQRPEYLGGSSDPIQVNTVAQTSQTATTPQGTLSAYATAFANGNGFTKSFTEFGLIMALVSVRADLTYQQGLHKSFQRQTRYDMFWPEFQHIGEQAVLMSEIAAVGGAADTTVWGY